MFNWLLDIWGFKDILLQGLVQTLLILTITSILGMALGWVLLGIRQLPFGLSTLASCMVYFNRNIPLIMLIALVHYGIMPISGFQTDFFTSACLALTLSSGAYFCEIYRAGLTSFSKEEKEAATVIGLNHIQKIVLILLPLVFLRMMPSILNQMASVIKDTSLAGLIGVIELTRAAEIVYENTFCEGPLLVMIAAVYFTIGFTLTKLAERFKLKATL